MTKTVISGAHNCLCFDKVAIIDVEGMILNARSSGLLDSGDNPVSTFRERLQAAAKLKEAGVDSLFILKKGGQHDGTLVREHVPNMIAWFDRHLGKK